MSNASDTWQLWSSDLFDREAPPTLESSSAGLRVGLAALWRAVLRQGVQGDGRPTFTDFNLKVSGRPPVALPRDPFRNPDLARLHARLEEVDFTFRLAELHERLLDQPFSFAPFLSLPVVLPKPVTQVAVALARTFGDGDALAPAPPGWRCGARVQISTGGFFAGNSFESGQTQWKVGAEGLVVTLDDIGEVGWTHAVTSDGSAGALVLRDALVAAGW